MKDEQFLRQALEISKNCKDVAWYGVGCLIVSANHEILASGYTGERCYSDGKMLHAEETAIEKCLEDAVQFNDKAACLYTTLEPCSERASGRTSCCERIIRAGIKSVVFAAREPFEKELGIVCRSEETLRQGGVQVRQISELQELCLAQALASRMRKD